MISQHGPHSSTSPPALPRSSTSPIEVNGGTVSIASPILDDGQTDNKLPDGVEGNSGGTSSASSDNKVSDAASMESVSVNSIMGSGKVRNKLTKSHSSNDSTEGGKSKGKEKDKEKGKAVLKKKNPLHRRDSSEIAPDEHP